MNGLAFLVWDWTLPILVAVLDAIAVGHAVLHKRDSRAAVTWVGLILFAPIVGAALYAVFGINRIHRTAVRYRETRTSGTWPVPTLGRTPPEVRARAGHLGQLVTFVGRVTRHPLAGGNRVTPLVNGDEAYPAMLEAIAGARRSIALSTYIFDHDDAGALFRDALAAAHDRGVAVRVLVDDVGARYSWPSMPRVLARRGVRVGRFNVTLLPWRLAYLNLRNHRKILVTDGTTGFVGGMNIRAGHLLERRPPHPVQDLHFRLDGPIVRQLVQVFSEDWLFSTGESLEGEAWFPALPPAGTVAARGIRDGPDEDFDNARFTFLGAIACATRSVRICTPYFLPDEGVVTALGVAAMRGVDVRILLPRHNNLRFVQWASTAQLWQVLERGCRVFLTEPPFDHSKLMLVDDTWAIFGSSNWDARSFRLNFEFDVEAYDETLSERLGALLDAKQATARELSLADVDGRPLWKRLRDGVARLAAPYL